MDDVDSTQAQIARNMLQSGDWVTARLDGVAYLEKAPLKHWMTAVAFSVFGIHDWVARLPIALGAIALAWVVFRFGRWAFSERVGYYAGLVTTTSVGMFLFTRIVIPDVIMTLAVTLAIWGFLRALDEDEPRPRVWAYTTAASLAAGVLLKGLIGAVFPLGAGFFYLLFTRRLFSLATWRRLYPFTGALLFAAIAAPWHVLATLRNPPYFDFTMHSGPGEYRGFFWFYFMNEHVLRFLNRRYPHDYNTVPRVSFWLMHLLWFFPWSAYLPSVVKLGYRPQDRAGRVRMMALCWIAVVMLFFSFSTTQEYYSMPIYPAVALLIGCGIEAGGRGLRIGTRVVAHCGGSRGRGRDRNPGDGTRHAGNGRYRFGAHPESGRLHLVAGAHAGPHAGALSPTCVHRWHWQRVAFLVGAMAGLAAEGHARVRRTSRHDAAILPGGAAGPGGVRSVSVFPPAG